jgi:DNA-3-methyladenine glycosylase II
LKAAAEFGFGYVPGGSFDGAMRLAFAVDGGRGHAGVVLRQPALDGPVEASVQVAGGADADVAVAQAARIVSLDHDGQAFLRVGDRDPVIGALQRAHPGQRPVLFHSPYEAAAWAIISARRPAASAARVRQTIAETHGATFSVAGQTLKGLGPFYAGLVVLRASGFADAMLAMNEPRVLARAGELYGLDGPPSLEEFAALAENWRPFRTWAMVLIRLGGDRAA